MVLKQCFSRDHGIVWRAERSLSQVSAGHHPSLVCLVGTLGDLEGFGSLIDVWSNDWALPHPVVIQAEVLELV